MFVSCLFIAFKLCLTLSFNRIDNKKYTCKVSVEQPKLSQTKLTIGKGKSGIK